MAVLLDTSLGSIVIDLLWDEVPQASKNFVKLCKKKYYNNNVVHNVERGYWIQTGDPTGTGKGGESIYGRTFKDEINPKIRHDKPGVVTMANKGRKHTNGSQFIITLQPQPMLDGKHTIFGQVAEGMDILEKISSVNCDPTGRPYRNIRIRHTHVLHDPFDDPPGMRFPSRSPSPKPDKWDVEFLPDYKELSDDEGKTIEQINSELQKKTDKTRELVLTLANDKPDIDLKPPDNVLFVCKLNPVTEDEDLEMIFSRFGKVLSCEIIRDYKTGDSLSYAFIEYETREICTKAWLEMDNCLIDERRIRVDFCQSVAKMWGAFQRGGKFALKNKRAFNANKGMSSRKNEERRGRVQMEFGDKHQLQSSQRLRNQKYREKRKRSRSRSRSQEKKRKKKHKKKKKKDKDRRR